MKKYVLTLSCKDRVGIVAAVTRFLAAHDGFILESSQFGDASTGMFFMRTVFTSGNASPTEEGFLQAFAPLAKVMEIDWKLVDASYRPKLLIMVSKASHCLNALLNKFAMGTLQAEVAAVVSNHRDLEKMCSWYDIPYHYLPVTEETKVAQEQRLIALAQKLDVDLIILARYMQILSSDVTRAYSGKIINIHHSFLPSFKGAKPYHQAYDRGVKLIGATAHYVTENLDEGPIIEQEVARVDHTDAPQDLVEIGHDIESLVLVRAVKYHLENRIFLNDHKTVVFR